MGCEVQRAEETACDLCTRFVKTIATGSSQALLRSYCVLPFSWTTTMLVRTYTFADCAVCMHDIGIVSTARC